MDMNASVRSVRSASEEGQQQRQQDTQDDRGRQREIETRSCRAGRRNRRAAGRTARRASSAAPRPAMPRPDQNQRLAHRHGTELRALVSVSDQCLSRSTPRRSSRFRTPPSPAHRIRAWRCARSTRANSLRSVPAIGLGRIGRAHQRAPLLDRVRRLEHQHDRRPRRHERRQAAEERPLAVHGVEAFGLPPA